jgi:hypothetical protein
MRIRFLNPHAQSKDPYLHPRSSHLWEFSQNCLMVYRIDDNPTPTPALPASFATSDLTLPQPRSRVGRLFKPSQENLRRATCECK